LIYLYTGEAWDNAVKIYSSIWQAHIKKFLASLKTPTLVVKYENLITDLHTELKRMMEFLKFPYTEDDLQCTINSTIEGFHRKHNKNITDPYTPDLRKFVMAQINLAKNILHQYNITYS